MLLLRSLSKGELEMKRGIVFLELHRVVTLYMAYACKFDRIQVCMPTVSTILKYYNGNGPIAGD